ncbi:hypothetical protein HanOQP8_Chr06g0225361 [Helianthus annuus]|nr:hypothetical protein HanOQP8_Chr06g0225361 [Helianthus annuus]
MLTTLGAWKDQFFWVLESIVPFKMIWRHPDVVLNEPKPSDFELNSCFLKAIQECPSRVRPFLEHLLVLLGINKLWDKPDRDPVLMRNGRGMHFIFFVFLYSFNLFTYTLFHMNFAFMSALDFVKSDDTLDVAFMDAEAAAGDDAVVRGSEHRFEGLGYVNVKGFTKVTVPKVSTRRSNRRMLKATGQSSTSEHVVFIDDIEVSGDQGPGGNVEKEKNLVVIAKKKSEGKKVVVTFVQGSPRKDIEGLSEDEIYVPNWGVKFGDSFKDANVCADVLANFSPLGVRGSISEMEGDTMLSRLILSSCNLSALLAEGVTHFRKGIQEYDEFSKKKDKMKASMAAMKRILMVLHKRKKLG